MAYNWAQLAFVEKWRLSAVRGPIVGMHRPADRTFFDLRLRPGEGNLERLPGAVDVRLQDAGDIIRDKRILFLSTATVVIRVVAASVSADRGSEPRQRTGRLLEAGSTLAGSLVSLEEDTALLHAGFPVVVQLPEPAPALKAGDTITISIAETPKGFLVV